MTKPDTSPLRARLVVAASAAALLLSACTGAPSEPADPAETPAQTQTESPGTAASTPTSTAQGEAPRATATPEALAVIQARETSTSRGPVTVGVNSLVVRGDVMTLNFSVTNTGTGEWMPWTDFNDGKGGLDLSVDGVYVVDATNGKRHLPARDANDNCVCSVPGNQRVQPGDTVTYSAVYRAVPAGVDTVSVFIPSAGVFDDIPVTR